MLGSILDRWRSKQGRLLAIYVTPAAGRPMQTVDSVLAIAGAGLEGDRYAAGAGFWKATDACQVTLISEDDLRHARTGRRPELRERLASGHHRRNLVVGGIRTGRLDGRRFRIGDAVFGFDKPRPPCGYLDRVEGDGMCRALGRHSGVCLRVLRGGTIAVGDTVELLDDGEPLRCA